MAQARRDVFQAIADPTRRSIIEMLDGRTLTLNAIAEKFDVTRQAISLHIRILEECGLVIIDNKGRERHCSARPDRLAPAAKWLEQYENHWNRRLDSLETYIDQIKKERSNGKRKK